MQINMPSSYQYSLQEFLRQIDPNKAKLKKIEAILHGAYQSTKSGPGFDFNEIREYKMGDDLRHISWNATAKTGTLQVKEYFTEKEMRSYFLIDISNSMFCGNKMESFVQLVAFLLNFATSFSEKIGGVFFSNDIKYHFPMMSSSTQANIMFQTFLNLINNLSSKITPFTNTDIYKAIEFTKRYFNKKGLIFLISDFINISHWEKATYELSQKQNIYSFQIYDPIDFYLPQSGYITIVDPETSQRSFVNTDSKKVQKTYHNLMNTKQENLNKFLKSIGVNHIIIEKNDF